ncbi:Uma2 family endonuclease [Actinomadura adrarensis]|uniref:Uma2 family endonuclease n=1 Tax=Actinomadura adrarensis TaxID=1819600 RepID=A0ABW3CQC1_9ACTN
MITTLKVDASDLPDTPYNLWVRGELEAYVDAPEGSRIEIIGGEIVVSPGPTFEHDTIVKDLLRALTRAELSIPDFPWTGITTGLSLVGVGDGYIPDLMMLDEEIYRAARQARINILLPDQVELVVEVTSPSNAANDRLPTRAHPNNKWNGYAAAEIPYYLLVDRSPKRARSILYSIPNQATAAYLHSDEWEFGETIHLPDPLDLEIDTGLWLPWKD